MKADKDTAHKIAIGDRFAFGDDDREIIVTKIQDNGVWYRITKTLSFAPLSMGRDTFISTFVDRAARRLGT